MWDCLWHLMFGLFGSCDVTFSPFTERRLKKKEIFEKGKCLENITRENLICAM